MQQPLPADENAVPRRDRVATGPRLVEPMPAVAPTVIPHDLTRWSSILAGFFVATAFLIVLDVLDVAIGATASANAPGGAGPAPGSTMAWLGGLFALIALFCGGWVAARYAGVGGTGVGMANAIVSWAVTVVFVLLIAGMTAGTIGGIVGSNFSQIAHAYGTTGTTGAQAQQAVSSLRDGSWWTLVALVLTFIASLIGGWVGARQPNVSTR